MGEAVKSQRMYNVTYNVPAANVVIGKPEVVSVEIITNQSSQPHRVERYFTYTKAATTNWNSTGSSGTQLGVPATVTAAVPFLAGGVIQISPVISQYEWGRDITTVTATMEDMLVLDVPPMSTVTISLSSTRDSYDIPFTYTQQDTLANGGIIVYEKNDGLAVGSNNYDFFYQVKEESLASSTTDAVAAQPAGETREYRIAPHTSRIVPAAAE